MKTVFPFAMGLLLLTCSCFGSDPSQNPLASRLEGLTCQIFDEPAVSHARASDELGAIACLGYLHGRDRAWQMDFLRRIAQGRKSEILGYQSLQDDLQMRMLGLDRKAKQLFKKMTEAERAPFWAYAYGVNQGFATDKARDAYEFKHYDYEPEEWTPIDSLEVTLLQSFDQTQQSFTYKLDEYGWLQSHGAEAQALFSREGLPWATTILKRGEYPLATSSPLYNHETPTPLPSVRIPHFPTGDTENGSNNWVISSARSRTGNAWFANDPHLAMKHPPFWYWAHIEGGRIDVIGASLPGMPTIVSGTNRHVSWGLTNSYFDVAELGLIPLDDLKTYGSKVRWPLVWVKFGAIKLPFFFMGFQRTMQDWPILPIPGMPSDRALVLRWSGFDLEPKDLAGFQEILVSSTVQEADRAFSHVGLPSWNFVFADTNGAIGYRTVGKLPKREHPLPFGIPERSLADWAPWTYLSADEAPHVIQPARGYIATANNRQWPGDAAFKEGRGQTTSFRAFRVEELLNQTQRHDLASIQNIQCDQQAVDARFLRTSLLKALHLAAENHGGLNDREVHVYEEIAHWDLQADLNCKACGVWVRWTSRLMNELNLNQEALYRLLQAAPTEAFANAVLTEFRGALDDVRVGTDGEMKSWGEIHLNSFKHFSGDPAFDVPGIPTGGVKDSVNPAPAEFDPKTGTFSQTSGASQRLVVELSNPPSVYAILAGSNQDIEKPNLKDPNGPWMKWSRCEYERRHYPLDWSQVPAQDVPLH